MFDTSSKEYSYHITLERFCDYDSTNDNVVLNKIIHRAGQQMENQIKSMCQIPFGKRGNSFWDIPSKLHKFAFFPEKNNINQLKLSSQLLWFPPNDPRPILQSNKVQDKEPILLELLLSKFVQQNIEVVS